MRRTSTQRETKVGASPSDGLAAVSALPPERVALKIGELCAMLGISDETLRRWRNLGIDPPGRFTVGLKRNGLVFYDRQSVETWLRYRIAVEARRTPTASAAE